MTEEGLSLYAICKRAKLRDLDMICHSINVNKGMFIMLHVFSSKFVLGLCLWDDT